MYVLSLGQTLNKSLLSMFAASCCSSSGRSGRSTPDFLIYVALWNNSIGTMHSRSLLGTYPITIIYAK